jgi:hypothetical protein
LIYVLFWKIFQLTYFFTSPITALYHILLLVSHPPSSITDSQVHEDGCDRPATQSLLERNEKPPKSVATINQRKRKNHKRKNKIVVNETLLQDSPGSAEGASINEPTKDLISLNLLPVPATSAESVGSSYPLPIQARPINSRERDLLGSLYEMLVESVNRTDSRALRTVKSKAPTLCSDGETIVGQAIAQKRKNSCHSKEARKRPQAIQRRRKRESRLSITIPSLSSHNVSPELLLPRPSFKRPKHRIEEGERSPSAPPVLLHSQLETSTYSGSPFINPWDRPALAPGNLLHTQIIRAVSCIVVYGWGSMESSSRHGEGYSMCGLNPICRPTKAESTEVLLCLHYTDCCHYAGYLGTTENALDGQSPLPGAGKLLVVVVKPLGWACVV